MLSIEDMALLEAIRETSSLSRAAAHMSPNGSRAATGLSEDNSVLSWR
jgi:molybdenum-dependent DNA-binding transcriptional regulator ModE